MRKKGHYWERLRRSPETEKSRPLRPRERSWRSEFPHAYFELLRCEVIAGQVDMLPTQRRQVPQQPFIDTMAVAAQRVRRPLQVDRVPQHDGRRHQVEAAGLVALLLETVVADFAQAVEEHGTGQRVAGFALVQPGMHAAAQFHALQPVQDEQRALDASPARASATAKPFWRG